MYYVYKCYALLVCAGVDDVFAVNSVDGFAEVNQHTGSWNAACT